MKVRARKRFGQHFLHDNDVINRIIDHVEPSLDSTWIEIGPGRGE
jgi:16S rRNA (adenine1518-N6/adenine1519-N6)-dimethyltransferase